MVVQFLSSAKRARRPLLSMHVRISSAVGDREFLGAEVFCVMLGIKAIDESMRTEAKKASITRIWPLLFESSDFK